MNDDEKAKLFRTWANRAYSPKRLIEDFVAVNSLRWEEHVPQLERIVDYAMWLSREGRSK